MSAHVLLNLLIEFRKIDKIRSLSSILSLVRNEFKFLTFIKLPFVIKIFVLSIFEWLFTQLKLYSRLNQVSIR